ncbi:MAG: DNA repair protein RadA [Lactobacillus sp.]|nr:DNA repair protein RadA [Lactobacillus sp.]
MPKARTQYKCQTCGYISASYLGRCPNCGGWNQFVEEKKVVKQASNKALPSQQISAIGNQEPVKLSEVEIKEESRFPTEFRELDRVLGGGIVKGSLILLGGEPGIGKSTLMLHVTGKLALKYKVLYVSGEESASQIKLRADRLGISSDNLLLYPETNMEKIRETIADENPDFVVIDSIQTMNEPSLDSMSGSTVQVREVTSELMKIAKIDAITVFVIGHVTKEGNIAGPKVLEHMVDTVLYFEGDEHHSYRMIRSVKNRFGAANEIGIFEMEHDGLVEVSNPSALFLKDRLQGSIGSAIAVSLEGTRPIMAEIEALVTPTAFGYAKRTTSGLDYNRASLLLAVLEKQANLMLQNQDAYLTTVGGMKLTEPALDLATCMAITSSYKNVPISGAYAFCGEVGLTGEVRRVTQIEDRIKEASQVGFERIFVPAANFHRINQSDYQIEIIPVKSLPQAIKLVFS